MDFRRENAPGLNVIREYADGCLRVAGRTLTGRVILSADELIQDWPATAMEQLTSADLSPVLALEPELVLLGSGPEMCFPPAEIAAHIMRLGIGFEVMSTAAACRTFNVLLLEERAVVAALFL